MTELLGTTLPVFITITVVVLGFAAFMTGQALGNNWQPVWQLILYCLLLGCADRFLTFALFEGTLLSVSGYVIDTAVLIAIALVAYRFNRARRIVSQYPWLYERTGPFTWRQKG